MNNKIFKMCKVHGALTLDKTYEKKNYTGTLTKYYGCRACRRDYQTQYSLKNPDKSRLKSKKASADGVKNLTDRYVLQNLTRGKSALKHKFTQQDIIERRQQILNSRAAKAARKT